MERPVARRIRRELTPAESKRLKKDRELISKELPDLIEKDQIRHDAAKEDTLSGELRRAIHSGGILIPVLAEKVGVSMNILDDFLLGERTLRSDIVDRLALVLGLKLRKTAPKSTVKTA